MRSQEVKNLLQTEGFIQKGKMAEIFTEDLIFES
jgi:hypothetical protein